MLVGGKFVLCPNKCNCLTNLFPDKSSYVLSVRDADKASGDPCVKHYRVRKMDNGGYFISPKRIFKTIFEVVDHYSGRSLFSSLKSLIITQVGVFFLFFSFSIPVVVVATECGFTSVNYSGRSHVFVFFNTCNFVAMECDFTSVIYSGRSHFCFVF